MNMLQKELTALALLTVAAAGPAVQAPSLTQHSKVTGVYVFDQLVIDLNKDIERFGPAADKISRCSDEKYFCLSSRILHLSLPRTCRAAADSVYGSGGNMTAVLDRHVHWRGSPAFSSDILLGNSLNKNIVYGYRPETGIGYIIYDPSNTLDLVDLAKRGDLVDKVQRWQDAGDNVYSHIRRDLITLDQLGRCDAT